MRVRLHREFQNALNRVETTTTTVLLFQMTNDEFEINGFQKKSEKVKKLPRVVTNAFQSCRWCWSFGRETKDIYLSFISILANDAVKETTETRCGATIHHRATTRRSKEARDIPSSREKYNNAQRRSSADTFLKEERIITFISNLGNGPTSDKEIRKE